MTVKLAMRSALIALLVGLFAGSLSAQKVELYPNAGGFWPDNMNTNNHLRNEGIYGLKAGVFLTNSAQVEGSVGYINHFELRNAPNVLNPSFGIASPTVYGVLYDVNGSWNFGTRQFLNARVSPFISIGAGGLTANVRHGNSVNIQGGGFVFDANGNAVANPARSVMMNDGDTFLTLNYGGGVKAMNLWGPVGLRADVRGRTIPNFYGETTSWPEVTGGITFTWGER
jgi:hypothetical protein